MRSIYAFKIIWDTLRDWWFYWIQLIWMNFLWILCWLTVVLGPPATFAMYEATNDIAQGISSTLNDLIPFIRKYFAQSWLWFVINVIAYALILLTAQFYAQIDTTWAIAGRTIVAMVAIYWSAMQFYAIPLFVLQEEKKIYQAWRNSLVIIGQTPLFTLIMLIFSVLFVFLSVGTIILLTLAGLTLVMIMGSRATRYLMNGIETEA